MHMYVHAERAVGIDKPRMQGRIEMMHDDCYTGTWSVDEWGIKIRGRRCGVMAQG